MSTQSCRALALSAGLGLASLAGAQTGHMTFEVVPATTNPQAGEPVQFSVFIDATEFDTGGDYFAIGGARFEVVLDGLDGGVHVDIPDEADDDRFGNADQSTFPDNWPDGRRPGTEDSGFGMNGSFRIPGEGDGITNLEWLVRDQDADANFHDAVLTGAIGNAIDLNQFPEVINGGINREERIEVLRFWATARCGSEITVDVVPQQVRVFTGPFGYFNGNVDFVDASDLRTEPASVTFEGSETPVVFGELTANRTVLRHGQNIRLTLDGLCDGDGNLAKVRFLRDENGNGILDAGDEFLGKDQKSIGGWEFAVTAPTSWETRRTWFFAEAIDADGNRAPVVRTEAWILGEDNPWISSLRAEPDVLDVGQEFKLRARGVIEPADPVKNVRFFEDTNGDGRWSLGDTLIGNDDDSDGGWEIVATAQESWGEGTWLFAVANDTSGLLGAAIGTTVVIDGPAGLTLPCPGDLDGDGVMSVLDLQGFLGEFQAGSSDADVNADGIVNTDDLMALLSLFGVGCE